MKGKPILCLDFDGVCHSYTSGWKGAAIIPDPPVDGLFDFLLDVSEHFDTVVFSSRSNQDGGMVAMRDWFVKYYKSWRDKEFGPMAADDAYGYEGEVLLLVRFVTEKPPAQVSLDDRCLTFTGIWPDVQNLRNFKPWNQKETKV